MRLVGSGCLLSTRLKFRPRCVDTLFSTLPGENVIFDCIGQKNNPDYCKQEIPKREYFYSIDLQGRLFLEETTPKNMTSSLKDENFLSGFFKRLKPNNLVPTRHPSYPFVSPCGRELNFVLPLDVPIVFNDLIATASNQKNVKAKLGNSAGTHTITTSHCLVSSGGLLTPWNPASLRVSQRSGRMYHPTLWGTVGSCRKERACCLPNEGYGLVRSQLAVKLGEQILAKPENPSYMGKTRPAIDSSGSGDAGTRINFKGNSELCLAPDLVTKDEDEVSGLFLEWEGTDYPIRFLSE